ncbi:MAG: hypothetical protein PHU95_05485 [Candidatus Thermoplasmatota archaeon]|nr:hypothetical protein [Candidatus Thermoplasmatota archaeon]MDD5778878.1 hypothetical protein [Candidatus Thermoplasmatota archaeon]
MMPLRPLHLCQGCGRGDVPVVPHKGRWICRECAVRMGMSGFWFDSYLANLQHRRFR